MSDERRASADEARALAAILAIGQRMTLQCRRHAKSPNSAIAGITVGDCRRMREALKLMAQGSVTAAQRHREERDDG